MNYESMEGVEEEGDSLYSNQCQIVTKQLVVDHNTLRKSRDGQLNKRGDQQEGEEVEKQKRGNYPDNPDDIDQRKEEQHRNQQDFEGENQEDYSDSIEAPQTGDQYDEGYGMD